MKIGVITFSDFNTNYGSMLQAFSMKLFLERQGHKVTFIRYREYNQDLNAALTMKSRALLFAKKTAINIYSTTKYIDIKNRKKSFDKFKQQYFRYTRLFTSNDELRNDLERFDAYICGSDQIWNIDCLGGLRTPYFLNFAPKDAKRIAYAASMGDYTIPVDMENSFREQLKNLDYISVREKESVSQLSQLSPKKIFDVVDPVFLNSDQEWGNFLPDMGIRQPYAVCYLVRRSAFAKEIIRFAKEYYRIPIFNLSDNQIYINGTSSKYISVGPLEFVSLIQGASFAIGTSFHLAAFSVLFDTPVLIAGLESNRSRICNIFKLACLEENFVTESDDYKKKVQHLSSSRADKVELQKKIVASKKFLAEALGE